MQIECFDNVESGGLLEMSADHTSISLRGVAEILAEDPNGEVLVHSKHRFEVRRSIFDDNDREFIWLKRVTGSQQEIEHLLYALDALNRATWKVKHVITPKIGLLIEKTDTRAKFLVVSVAPIQVCPITGGDPVELSSREILMYQIAS